jgi:polyisoprenoid-binding protein YceI
MRSLLLGTVLLVAACGPNASQVARAPAAAGAGSWSLVPDASRVSFVSVKAGQIAEVHHFTRVSGTVAPDGTATLTIPLDSVETGIPVRNERMRQFLFQTGLHPKATLTTKIDLGPLAALAPGQQTRLPLSGNLSLHGVTAPVETTVTVTRAGGSRVVVASLDPVIVNADSFGLGAGVAELMKLAKLDSITADVPVSFQLTFARGA